MADVAVIEDVPGWTYQEKVPSIYTFFEAIALAGLEERPIRLSASLQRSLLGSAVFGRRAIVVRSDGTIQCTIVVGFGRDFETAVWSAKTVQQAASARKQLRPGTTGGGYSNA